MSSGDSYRSASEGAVDRTWILDVLLHDGIRSRDHLRIITDGTQSEEQQGALLLRRRRIAGPAFVAELPHQRQESLANPCLKCGTVGRIHDFAADVVQMIEIVKKQDVTWGVFEPAAHRQVVADVVQPCPH